MKKQVKPTRRQTKTGNIVPKAAPTQQTDDLYGANSPFPIMGIASTERDITERKRKEEEASRMVTVVRDSNDAITIQDFGGKILAWNHGAELMFGFSEQEALRMTIWQLAPPDKAAEQKDFNRRIFAGENVSSFETQRLTKDGRILDVWLTVTKLVDDTGNVIGIASTERDITDRKRNEEEISRLNEHLEKRIKEQTDKLNETITHLKKLNQVFVGRELKMMELKARIAELEKKT